MLKDERHITKNAPASPAFKIKENNRNVSSEKTKWIALIEEYAHF